MRVFPHARVDAKLLKGDLNAVNATIAAVQQQFGRLTSKLPTSWDQNGSWCATSQLCD